MRSPAAPHLRRAHLGRHTPARGLGAGVGGDCGAHGDFVDGVDYGLRRGCRTECGSQLAGCGEYENAGEGGWAPGSVVRASCRRGFLQVAAQCTGASSRADQLSALELTYSCAPAAGAADLGAHLVSISSMGDRRHDPRALQGAYQERRRSAALDRQRDARRDATARARRLALPSDADGNAGGDGSPPPAVRRRCSGAASLCCAYARPTGIDGSHFARVCAGGRATTGRRGGAATARGRHGRCASHRPQRPRLSAAAAAAGAEAAGKGAAAAAQRPAAGVRRAAATARVDGRRAATPGSRLVRMPCANERFGFGSVCCWGGCVRV
jgi:hypothetical protein